MMKEIDLTTYKKRNQFRYFSTFSDPTYGFDVDVDVEAVVALARSRQESFFPFFLYFVIKGVNSVEEMRLRIVKGKVLSYEEINPTWTVMTESGVYMNSGMEMDWDFDHFAKKVKAITEEVKKTQPNEELDLFPICAQPDVVYATCIPSLAFKGMTHPTPSGDPDSLSVPRICWGQFRKENDGRCHLTLNITVSHALVDGFPLAQCFNAIKAYCLAPEENLRK